MVMEKGNRALCCSVAILCFSVSTIMPFSLSISSLPRDEYEASAMIREGLLDSLDWERLRQFYVQPLNVPSGDLKYLKELTELWDNDFPVSPSQLKKYIPWEETDIQRFFSDFPQLVAFEPILSFTTAKKGECSDVSLNIEADQTLRPTALSRFTSCISPRFSISGSLYHEDSTLSWRTKSINVIMPGVARIETGNFENADDRGLFFGYFPEDREPQTTLSNWLYGDSRTWNGIMAETECWEKVHVNAFIHERRTENVQAITCKTEVGRLTEVVIGMSRLLKSLSDSTYYLQGGIQGRLAGFDASMHTGIDAEHPLAVPLSVQVIRKSESGLFKFLGARIPGSLRLPLSSIASLCRRDYDTAYQNGVFPDMTLLECRTTLYPRKGTETSMDLCSIFNGSGADLRATVRAQGASFVGYRLEYSCRMQTDSARIIHNVNITVKRELAASATMCLSCKYFFRDRGGQSVFFRVPLDIAVKPAMTVSPFLTYFSNTGGEHAAGAGLKQTLYCFEKTWCEWSGQFGCDERNIWDWNVEIRTNFWF
jgi:hypothetical protein